MIRIERLFSSSKFQWVVVQWNENILYKKPKYYNNVSPLDDQQ